MTINCYCMCVCCKNEGNFPMIGVCYDCENYSKFEIAEPMLERKFKNELRKHEIFVFMSVIVFFMAALLLGACK